MVWLTGLSGSGKSTVAVEVERILLARRQPTVILDGDNLRHGLNSDLGFSDADRAENIRRVGEVSVLFADAGVVALVPLISPFRSARTAVRETVERSGLAFFEVYVDTPIENVNVGTPRACTRERDGVRSRVHGDRLALRTARAADLVLTPASGPPDAAGASGRGPGGLGGIGELIRVLVRAVQADCAEASAANFFARSAAAALAAARRWSVPASAGPWGDPASS